MGYLEGLSKSIDVAVPLALKLHEINRKREQWNKQFKAAREEKMVDDARDALKTAALIGMPLTDKMTTAAGMGSLPREAVFSSGMEAPSAEALRAKLAGHEFSPLENLQITPTNPVPGRGFQAEDFEGATKFDVSGQKIIQPVSEATKKLQATIAERLLARDEKIREFDEAQQTRRDIATMADATRRELGEAGLELRRDMGESTNLLRQALTEIQRGNLAARQSEIEIRRRELQDKMTDADKKRLDLINKQLEVTPAAKEGWFGGKPESDPRQDLLNQYDAILKKYDKLAAGAPKPSNVIRYDAKGNRL
jgi:hypothetical protein